VLIDLQTPPPSAQQLITAPVVTPETQKHSAPAINTHPTQETERDGFLIIAPAGAAKSAYHLGHIHGWGGLSKGEDELLHKMAAGKDMGESITTAAPLSKLVDPKNNWVKNTDDAVTLLRYMMTKPRDLRDQFLTALMGENKGLAGSAKGLAETIRAQQSWFSFVFDNKSLWAKAASLGKATLEPNYDKTIDAMAAAGERLAPRLHTVLSEIGAKAGHIGLLGFSQGSAVALATLNHLPADYIKDLVLVSGTYVETTSSPKIRNSSVNLDVVCPLDDTLLEIIGIKEDRMLADLAAAFPGRTTVWKPPGGHALAGEVAHLVAGRFKEALQRRRYGAIWVGPGG